MEMVRIFGLPAALLVLAFVANRLSKLTRVPDIIVLLLIGVTLGPILHWVNPETFKGAVHILGMLALILILFEGGLELRLRQALRYFPAGLLLVVLSFGLSLGLITLMCRALLHLNWSDCVLIGAALGCTSGTIVIPALQQMVVPEPVKITLTIEAALGEVIAVLIVGSMLNMGPQQSLISGMAADFFFHSIVIALIVGVVFGMLWWRLWPFVAGLPYSNILNLGVVLGIFAIARYAGGSGLLAELIFGVTLANVPRTPHMVRQSLRMHAFHAEVSFLVRSFFFVMLGIVAEFISRRYVVPILGILAALLLARFLAVQLSRWAVRDVTRKQTELLFDLARGLVTAVLALEIVDARGAVFAFLPAMAFTVVLVTNLFIVWGAVKAAQASVVEEPTQDKALAMAASSGANASALPQTQP